MTWPESPDHTLLTLSRHRPHHDQAVVRSPRGVPMSTTPVSTKNKIIAGAVAGLAVLSGTFAVVVGGTDVAHAATSATSAVTGSTSHPVRAWLRAHRKEIRAAGAKTVASTIGISTDELKQDLEGGQSISEIATAHNVDPQAVATALVDQIDAQI